MKITFPLDSRDLELDVILKIVGIKYPRTIVGNRMKAPHKENGPRRKKKIQFSYYTQAKGLYQTN